MSIYDASQEYVKNNVDTVVIAGNIQQALHRLGSKRTKLLGISSYCSFERIHRSNLIGMGANFRVY